MANVIITRITGRFQREPERTEGLSLIAASCLAEQAREEFLRQHPQVHKQRFNRGHEVEERYRAGSEQLQIVTQYAAAPAVAPAAPVVPVLTAEQRDAQSRRDVAELWG